MFNRIFGTVLALIGAITLFGLGAAMKQGNVSLYSQELWATVMAVLAMVCLGAIAMGGYIALRLD